jgi:hypothetical protein
MQAPAKYLVIIESGGSSEAIMFTPERKRVADFDASIEETALMARGLTPAHGASGPEWDHALAGHSADERANAVVYTLDV